MSPCWATAAAGSGKAAGDVELMNPDAELNFADAEEEEVGLGRASGGGGGGDGAGAGTR